MAISDLNIQLQYEASVLKFGFNNLYEEEEYKVILRSGDGNQLMSATAYCSEVGFNEPCYGFMMPGSDYDETSLLYIEVKFANGSNSVIASHGQAPAIEPPTPGPEVGPYSAFFYR